MSCAVLQEKPRRGFSFCAVCRLILRFFASDRPQGSTLGKVILPEISPAILSAFLICLTYSIDDFMISYFNCGTVETLPIAIYSMTRKKVSPEIYALSTIMFVVILCIILISNAMESRSYRRDQKALRGEGV